MKFTLAEIDSIIERGNQWTRHRQAMQIMGNALRAHNHPLMDMNPKSAMQRERKSVVLRRVSGWAITADARYYTFL